MNKNEIRKLVKEELDKMLEAPETKAPTDAANLQKAEENFCYCRKASKNQYPR